MNVRLFGRVFFLSKTILYITAVVLSAAAAVAGFFYLKNENREVPLIKSMPSDEISASVSSAASKIEPGSLPETIKVYIVGAVRNPGIYEVAKKTVVYDIVNAAGGLLPETDSGNINMVQEINENLMLRVLTEEERKEKGSESSLLIIKDGGIAADVQTTGGDNGSSEDGQSGKININTAGKSELMTLPGIGEAKAQDIISYRETSGNFKAIEEIMNVNGIKEARFNAIKDLIIA